MIYPSTFSIVAYDPVEQAWGVAVASKFLAVGSVVPWARAGIGAVATQSYANTSFGPNGMDLMEAGYSASQVLEKLLADDPEREQRQVGMVDRQGGSATFTGKACFAWAGGVTGLNFAAQGNILAGEQVVGALSETFIKSSGSLAKRLHTALLAADRAGGDRRGRQSAAILVVKNKAGYGGFNDRWIDYRVDDHPDPVFRLGEILELHDLYFGKSDESERLPLEGEVLRNLQSIMTQLGYYHDTPEGIYDAQTRVALRAFIGNENFEERVEFETGQIDRPVYEYILQHFKKDQ